MSIAWEAVGVSDVGRIRRGNEDAVRVDTDHGVFLVADGMGGHAAGEIASAIAAETVGDQLARAVEAGAHGDEVADALRDSVSAAQLRMVESCVIDPRRRGMGTTLTALVLDRDGNLQLAHLGDSRAYRLRSGEMEQLTPDHTWVQGEIDAGRLPPSAGRSDPRAHILTRVLSADAPEPVDLLAGSARSGDRYLLASDGLTGMVEDAEIAHLLAEPLPLPTIAANLIAQANRNGGRDNISVVVVEIVEGS